MLLQVKASHVTLVRIGTVAMDKYLSFLSLSLSLSFSFSLSFSLFIYLFPDQESISLSIWFAFFFRILPEAIVKTESSHGLAEAIHSSGILHLSVGPHVRI
jgi:hypothetical protein